MNFARFRSRTWRWKPCSASQSSAAATRSRAAGESGFAYLMALVLVAVVIISSTAVLESIAIQERREREQEMIWRGNQYERAIRLYFHKVGRYPQTVDDLMKGVPGVHFLRQQYKDPMNHDDGAWRFIYLNQAGQIIGSTRYASLQQMALIDTLGLQPGAVPQGAPGQPGVPAASLANSGSNGSGAPPALPGGLLPALPYSVLSSDNPAQAAQAYYSSSDQSQSQNQTPPQEPDLSSGQAQPSNPSQSDTSNSQQSAFSFGQSQSGTSFPQNQGSSPFGQPGAQGNTTTQLSSPLASLNSGILQQKPTGAVDGPVLGAFLTGVGSTVDRKSIVWLHGARKYKDWEFIWNPIEEQAAAMQQQLNQSSGTGLQGGLPVANPFGGSTTQNPSPPSTPPPSQPQQ